MVTWKHLLQRTSIFGCCEDNSSPYVVVGIPLDQTTTYKPGTRFAPERIRSAACNLEFYSLVSEVSLEHIGFRDLGDLVISPGNLERVYKDIESVVKGIIEELGNDITCFFLGGEHTITYPIVKTLRNEIDQLIVFDAHTDLRDEYLGSRYNHATVMRRLFEELHIPITYIGVRAFSEEELLFIDENKDSIKLCDSSSIIKGECRLDISGKVYVSIDIDVLDPAYAPGVSNPEPLGLTTHQLIHYLYKVLESTSKAKWFDVVEVNPLVDVNDVTSIVAAKVILEIIGFYEKRSR